MNINIRTNKNFATQLNKLDQEYGEEFRSLQGLDEDKLSFTDFINNFIDIDTVADASVDASSNIAQKDVVVLLSEMSKPHQKLLAFHKLYYEIHKMYGFKVANEAFEALWNYAIYMHDFNTATFISYCFAYDIKDIVEKGLFFIDNYNAKPPKHLDSFVQILMEGICFLARRQSGAVGLPNLIPYLYYFWSRDVANGYYTKDPETYKKQQIQALIYRLNQP
ncbi:MAG: anaerobic ribonucleoside-triphosphate reductase, partial [Clostridia bacterium]|nr:anaerobic ribonucleoside-triphosphate reductase [Clostridia bacterium]